MSFTDFFSATQQTDDPLHRLLRGEAPALAPKSGASSTVDTTKPSTAAPPVSTEGIPGFTGGGGGGKHHGKSTVDTILSAVGDIAGFFPGLQWVPGAVNAGVALEHGGNPIPGIAASFLGPVAGKLGGEVGGKVGEGVGNVFSKSGAPASTAVADGVTIAGSQAGQAGTNIGAAVGQAAAGAAPGAASAGSPSVETVPVTGRPTPPLSQKIGSEVGSVAAKTALSQALTPGLKAPNVATPNITPGKSGRAGGGQTGGHSDEGSKPPQVGPWAPKVTPTGESAAYQFWAGRSPQGQV